MNIKKKLISVVSGFVLLLISNISSSGWDSFDLKGITDTTLTTVAESFALNKESQTKSPLETLASNDLVMSVGVGTLLGGILGYVIDGKDGAAKGAIVGAIAGFVAADIAKKRREKFVSESEFLDSEISSAETAISSKETQLALLEAKVHSMHQEINKLESRFKRNENISKEANIKLKELNDQIKQNEESAELYKNSIEYLDEVLKTSQSEVSATAKEKKAMQIQLFSMKKKRAKLSGQYARLNDVNEDLIQEKERLATLVEKSNRT